MKLCDPTRNPILACSTWNYIPGVTEFSVIGLAYSIGAVVAVAGAAVGGISAMAQSAQQAQAMQAQAQAQQAQAAQAQQIANYNATIQRQNAEVAYNMAVYQNQQNQQIALFNQQAALNNAAFAEAQAFGARRQYEQGIENAKQQALQADATRAQGREEARRKREENDRAIAEVRAKYGASGVAFEGSPLVVLSETARLGESLVQDIAYATELESRKELRQGEIEKFKAGFSLLDELGFKTDASTYKLKAEQFKYESDLYAYDSALAGVRLNIANKEADLTSLAGGAEAFGYQAAAEQSLYGATQAKMKGTASLISAGTEAVSGVTSATTGYYNYKGYQAMAGKIGATY